MLGNEGQGLSPKQIALCDKFVYIPQVSTHYLARAVYSQRWYPFNAENACYSSSAAQCGIPPFTHHKHVTMLH
jgi:hypothetical protein